MSSAIFPQPWRLFRYVRRWRCCIQKLPGHNPRSRNRSTWTCARAKGVLLCMASCSSKNATQSLVTKAKPMQDHASLCKWLIHFLQLFLPPFQLPSQSMVVLRESLTKSSDCVHLQLCYVLVGVFSSPSFILASGHLHLQLLPFFSELNLYTVIDNIINDNIQLIRMDKSYLNHHMNDEGKTYCTQVTQDQPHNFNSLQYFRAPPPHERSLLRAAACAALVHQSCHHGRLPRTEHLSLLHLGASHLVFRNILKQVGKMRKCRTSGSLASYSWNSFHGQT